tara:strand:+ start:42 stop:209 length:168 start_codon:yes stop_codon:yes gene_type:complete
MNVGDLLVYSQNLVDVEIFGIVIDIQPDVVVVATQQSGVRTYSKDVLNSFAAVAK